MGYFITMICVKWSILAFYWRSFNVRDSIKIPICCLAATVCVWGIAVVCLPRELILSPAYTPIIRALMFLFCSFLLLFFNVSQRKPSGLAFTRPIRYHPRNTNALSTTPSSSTAMQCPPSLLIFLCFSFQYRTLCDCGCPSFKNLHWQASFSLAYCKCMSWCTAESANICGQIFKLWN